MTKVTYLFGAGASANALPIVDKLPERITELVKKIKIKNLMLTDNKPFKGQSKKEYQLTLIKDLEWVSTEAKKHASVDPFAKKLFLKGENESDNLKRLKIALSIFFILEQSRQPVDVRYDAFFASILNETRDLSAQLDKKTMNEVVDVFADLKSDSERNLQSLLSFAWENEGSRGETIIDKAIACTQDTDVLVVIGYSFPFFNREVDRKIIGAMRNLSKVYFQAPDAENIKTRFQVVRSKDSLDNSKDGMPYPELVAYPEVGSFLLPDEL